jgi:Zn finger protein HypA/HybF involved in hydrogenase expression
MTERYAYFKCFQCKYVGTEEDFEDGCPRCACLAYEPY